jgi:hypothetical protein
MTLLGRLLRASPTRADRWALAILAALPVVLNLPFALAGTPLMGGDNLDQNFPLRVLSGELIAHGRLPLWNPDIWGGTPLLAGWNAGAMYPGTWLFAVLPGVAAWEVNAIAVGVIGGLGLHVFLRRQGCSAKASFLGALTFSYTGFMSGQSVHLGLVTGMALAPWMLIAVDQMARSGRAGELRRPVALLGACGGLVVLAGDPRAISNDAIVLVGSLCAFWWRRRASGAQVMRLLAGAAAGAALAVMLSVVQWLPGLAFLHQSQRSGGNLAYFGSYSLHGGQFTYLLSPFAFGGNGSLGLPTTNFNLPEFTYSVGILPLVAFFVLGVRAVAGRRRGQAMPSVPVGVWLALAVVGIVLSLGTNTPLAHLLVHVPLYGGQRLQSRNMGITDLALCVLLAVFLDLIGATATTGAPTADRAAGLPARLSAPERLAGAIPPVLVAVLITAMFAATAATERFLGATQLLLGLPVRMAPYYAFEAAVALCAAVAVTRERWRHPHRRRRLLAAVVGADVAMFLAMASYQLAPSSALAQDNAAVRSVVAAGLDGGRYAIFNPQQLPVAFPAHVLDDLGLDDLVVLHHLAFVQGYGSAVSGTYEDATGAHEVENLRPAALVGRTFDTLNLRVLVTLPELFGTPRVSPAAMALPTGPPRPPGTAVVDREPGNAVDFHPYRPAGPWQLGSRVATTFDLPGPLAVDQVALRLAGQNGSAPAPVRLRVSVRLRSGGRITTTVRAAGALAVARLRLAAVVAGGGALSVAVTAAPSGGGGAGSPSVLTAIAVHTVAWKGSVPLVSSRPSPASPGSWFQLDGLLQGLLPPASWSYEGNIGPLTLYRNRAAAGAAWLQPPGSLGVTTGRADGSVVQRVTPPWQDPLDVVSAPHGALLVRSETYSPGWSVTIEPVASGSGSGRQGTPARSGSGAQRGAVAVALPVRAVGLVQGVELPPGRWIVAWHYRSARAAVGVIAGALGSVALVGLLLPGGTVGRTFRRRRRRPEPGAPGGEPDRTATPLQSTQNRRAEPRGDPGDRVSSRYDELMSSVVASRCGAPVERMPVAAS